MAKLIEKYNKRIEEIVTKQKPMIFGNQWLILESERQTLTDVIVDLEREMANSSHESAALHLHDVSESCLAKCDVCGCHPSVIIRTEFGTFCQAHARYVR